MAGVVFEDNFDNDGLATNAGVGGGFVMLQPSPTGNIDAEDDGDLTFDTATAGASRETVRSINAFQLTGGFTFEFSYTYTEVFPSSSLQIGLLNTDSQVEPPFVGDSSAGVFGIGFAADDRASNDEIDFAGIQVIEDGDSSTRAAQQTVDNDGTTDVVLSMGEDTFGNLVFSYSVNGAAPSSGLLFGSSFDLSDDFYIYIGTQGADVSVSDIKLTVVPEPGSMALMGLGGLLVARRRR